MNWNNLNPLPVLREGTLSLLGDGKLSIKRTLALLFGIAILRMTWHVLVHIIPEGNQPVFMHCFDILAGLIIILTGAATVKDIIALKNGTKETTQIDTPNTTITKVTETPNAQ